MLLEAVAQHLISEDRIDSVLAPVLKIRFKLGMFDPVGKNPYDAITSDVVNSDAHRKLAREAAVKSMVLLKNDGVLHLKNDLSKYFITGPNTASIESMIGNYYRINPQIKTIAEGITAAIKPGSQLQYRKGVLLDRPNENKIDWTLLILIHKIIHCKK